MSAKITKTELENLVQKNGGWQNVRTEYVGEKVWQITLTDACQNGKTVSWEFLGEDGNPELLAGFYNLGKFTFVLDSASAKDVMSVFLDKKII